MERYSSRPLEEVRRSFLLSLLTCSLCRVFVHVQLYDMMSRDFIKAGYLHKTPANKLVGYNLKRPFSVLFRHILPPFVLAAKVPEEILHLGQAETDVL